MNHTREAGRESQGERVRKRESGRGRREREAGKGGRERAYGIIYMHQVGRDDDGGEKIKRHLFVQLYISS